MAGQGELYVFMVGGGLLGVEEANREWDVVKRGWGERYLLHLAVDPNAPQRLVVADEQGQLLISGNGGRDWSRLE